MNTNEPLKILLLAAEVVPFAKTGGLADVAGSLPKALKALGHDVRVAMPRYGRISVEKFDLKEALAPFPVPMDESTEPAGILQGTIGQDVPVYMVDSAKYYDREGIYMYPDDAERFIFFCRAAIEMLKQMDWQPDIIHCHDWHTAIVPNWMKTIYADDPFFTRTATVYTIHNLAYQGIFGHRVLEVAGIDEYGFLMHPDTADLNEVVDFMGRGIHFADVINTVSERYAQEILTPEFGERLDPILRDRRDLLFGVLNGIDIELMDPATDQYIAANYDVHNLLRRHENKLALQQEAKLPDRADVPLIGVISRLADQKGFDLLAEVMGTLMEMDLGFVLLGTGEEKYHKLFGQIARKYSKKAGIKIAYDNTLAHKIEAGADIFLMPSRYEPCGLNQMYSLKYGTVPVVRATGGLDDTIQDYNPKTVAGTGFKFHDYSSRDFLHTIRRALAAYRQGEKWKRLMVRGMKADFSWQRAAQQYMELYRKAMGKGGEDDMK